LHYSVVNKAAPIAQKDPSGRSIGVNLNKATTIDPAKYDVAPYLDQSLRAGQMLAPNAFAGAPTANPASAAPPKPAPPLNGSLSSGPINSFNDRFGSWKSLAPDGSINAPAPEVRPGGLPGLIADQLQRQGRSGAAPAPPLDETASPDDPSSFDERFKAASSIRRLSSPLDYGCGVDELTRRAKHLHNSIIATIVQVRARTLGARTASASGGQDNLIHHRLR
jgi:hypothetical protein